MDYEKIGKFILECRKEKNMTQKQLASLIGVTDKAVSKWERGLGCPDVSILGELSNALDIGIGELLNGEKDQKLRDNNEFIKQAVLFSKNHTQSNIYKKLSYLILVIITLLASYLLFINLFHIGSLNNETEYYFSRTEKAKLQDKYDLIKQKLEQIKILNFEKLENSELDYKSLIIETSESFLDRIDKTKLLEYEGKKYISKLEAINMEGYGKYSIASSNFLIYILEKVNPNYRELYPLMRNFGFVIHTLAYDMNMDVYNDKYYDIDLYYYSNINYNKLEVRNLLDNISYSMDAYNQILQLIIEAGEVNE